MLDGIHTESVNTHVDIVFVAVDQIVINCGVFGVQVETVTMECHWLHIKIIKVAAAGISSMMVNLIGVHCYATFIRHRHITSAVRRPYVDLDRTEVLGHAVGFIAVVNSGKIVCVVAVIVITGSVLNNRGDPDGGKAQCLDVIELVDQTFEVASPSRVRIRVLCFGIIDTMFVVVGIAVIETGGEEEVNGFIAEVRSGTGIQNASV